MTEPSQPGEAVVRRYLDKKHEAIFARGDFAPLFAAYDAHTRLWKIEPDALARIMMRQALGGAALYLSCRPLDEDIGWTLNIARPPLNLFFTGSAGSRNVTGRAFVEGIETTDVSRLFVDRKRRAEEPFRSVIDVKGHDVLFILERYSLQSDQASARFFEVSDDDYLMVAALPTDERDWIASLDRNSALELLDGLPPLDERSFWFQCGCDPDRMKATIKTLFEGRLDELFGGDDSVEINCPRCGRTWSLARDAL